MDHPIVARAAQRIQQFQQLVGIRNTLSLSRYPRQDIQTGLMEVLLYQQMQIERLERVLKSVGGDAIIDWSLYPLEDEAEALSMLDIDLPDEDTALNMKIGTDEYQAFIESLLTAPCFLTYVPLVPSGQEQFISKWRGNLRGHDLESAGRVYWARSFGQKLTSDSLVEMSVDYLSVAANEETSSRGHALRVLLENARIARNLETDTKRYVPPPVVNREWLNRMIEGYSGLRDNRVRATPDLQGFLDRWQNKAQAASETPIGVDTVFTSVLSRGILSPSDEVQLCMDLLTVVGDSTDVSLSFVSRRALQLLGRWTNIGETP